LLLTKCAGLGDVELTVLRCKWKTKVIDSEFPSLQKLIDLLQATIARICFGLGKPAAIDQSFEHQDI
jgi:hypothetical protein